MSQIPFVSCIYYLFRNPCSTLLFLSLESDWRCVIIGVLTSGFLMEFLSWNLPSWTKVSDFQLRRQCVATNFVLHLELPDSEFQLVPQRFHRPCRLYPNLWRQKMFCTPLTEAVTLWKRVFKKKRRCNSKQNNEWFQQRQLIYLFFYVLWCSLWGAAEAEPRLWLTLWQWHITAEGPLKCQVDTWNFSPSLRQRGRKLRCSAVNEGIHCQTVVFGVSTSNSLMPLGPLGIFSLLVRTVALTGGHSSTLGPLGKGPLILAMCLKTFFSFCFPHNPQTNKKYFL